MTRKDWQKLPRQKAYIMDLQQQIDTLQTMLDEWPTITDTVSSSTDEGNASHLCHAVISGNAPGYTTTAEKLRGLKSWLCIRKAEYATSYANAVEAINAEPDPEMRLILSDRLLKGKSYKRMARETGYRVEDVTIRSRVDRWIDRQIAHKTTGNKDIE